ncbi:DUF11 domain-containing protein [Spirosoma taeanense]|uniref:DUF11 domain-containing protein n=1 Tax=Spirosoma taeanense TaxID=2735870 RepID=A0A6M5YD73_9BACT|nr:SdrD B-like domain-containing protein [Spirosoma taeanense]QJW91211.1 DUF11 domain-containing protein [Spirosoma taeanense]
MKQLSDLCFLWSQRLFWIACLLLLAGKTAGAYTPDDNPPAPKVLAIGNRVFQDYNRNGIQDDGEPGIAKIPVRLYQNGVQRGETSTDEKGQYAFDDAGVKGGLQPNTVYEIRVNSTDFPAGFQLTKRKQGSDPNLDSDAQLIGGLAVVYANTGAAGTPNDSYDIGLAAGNPDLSITKSATTAKVTKGGNASFTIRVDNTGDGPATNVIVKDTLDAGMTYVSSSPAATVSTTPSSQTVLTWNLGTIAAAGTSNLSLTVNTQAEGVLYNTAYVTTTDTEVSTRNNVSRACVSVPIKLCPGDRYVASLPAQYTNVKWYKDNGTTAVATGNSFTITQAGSYSFTTTTNVDCPANGCCPIIVEDGIVPNLAITPASPAICAGSSTSLTLTGCGNGSIKWSSGESTASIVVAPTMTTTYSVTCTSATYGTCTGTASTTVTVNPLPIVALSSATICAGQTASLTATSGYATYTFSSGLTPAQGQPNVATGTAAGTYSVTATTSAGCSATATGSITVNPLPVVALSSATICAGQTASLTATAGYATYTFSSGLTPVQGQPNVATATTAGIYSVTATTSSGCSATATGSITVNPLPIVALSSATICAGQTASLTATSGYASYVFSSGLTPVQGQPNVATGTTAGTYSVTATTSSGCSATATGSITVNPLPTAAITVSSATICQGQSATLTASGGASYRWSTNEQTASIVVTTSGVYSVTATNAQGCSDNARTTITVNPAPVLTVNSPTLCAGQSATLTVGGCQGGTLVWSTGDNTASLIVTPLVTTTYSATCTFSTGCSSTTAATVTVNAAPTYEAAPTVTVATCNGGTPNNDARIDLTTLENVERADIVKGNSYGSGPAYGAPSNKVIVNGSVSFTNLANPTEKQPYTVRLFSAKGTCYTDVTVMLDAATCECPTPKCVPVVIQKIR